MSLSLAQVRRLRIPPAEVLGMLADLVSDAGEACQFIGGSIGFLVRGEGGGTWTLDLSVPGGALNPEASEEEFRRCTTRVYAFQLDLAALFFAPDAIVGLLETGRFVVEGRKDKLSRLGQLIENRKGGSQVSIRASTRDKEDKK